MIGIMDYGMGNLFSVYRALERLGADAVISGDPEVLRECDGLILPGVGAFGDAMVKLEESGLAAFLKEYVKQGKPLLGICLGMQLLFESSEEHGFSKGLGFLPGGIIRFTGDLQGQYKVPHMGWNRLSYQQNHPLLTDTEEDYVYFVHSFFARMEDERDLIASASYYDVDVPAIVGRNYVLGMQFHPEKSGKLGERLLQNFIKMVEERREVQYG